MWNSRALESAVYWCRLHEIRPRTDDGVDHEVQPIAAFA
jgi:hypothetical protein